MDVPRCVWIFIAALVVMFVIVSILSSTFFMKLFIFGGSYESVWNSMEPRMEVQKPRCQSGNVCVCVFVCCWFCRLLHAHSPL